MAKEIRNIVQDSVKLRKLIAENPELPICVIACKGAVGEYCELSYCAEVNCEIGYVLDCRTCFDYPNGEVFTDKEFFKSRITEVLSDDEDYADLSDDEYKKAVAKIAAEYEPYWKKVIAIYADN